MNNLDYKKLSIDILVDIVAGFLIAAGTYTFAVAFDFPLSGFTGVGLIAYQLFGLPIGTVATLMNIPFIFTSWKILGHSYILRSLRSMIITTIIIDIVAPMFPIYEGDIMLAAICCGVLPGIGIALIYLRESSTGGSDFIILSLKKLHPHMSIGNISFVIQAVIILAGTILVSKSVEGLIYGMVINYIISIVIDKIMYGISAGKLALIVTDYCDEVAAAIEDSTSRGSTYLKAQGSYTKVDKNVVMCACDNKQLVHVRRVVKEIDSSAFIIVLESNEVLGEGFKPH